MGQLYHWLWMSMNLYTVAKHCLKLHETMQRQNMDEAGLCSYQTDHLISNTWTNLHYCIDNQPASLRSWNIVHSFQLDKSAFWSTKPATQLAMIFLHQSGNVFLDPVVYTNKSQNQLAGTFFTSVCFLFALNYLTTVAHGLQNCQNMEKWISTILILLQIGAAQNSLSETYIYEAISLCTRHTHTLWCAFLCLHWFFCKKCHELRQKWTAGRSDSHTSLYNITKIETSVSSSRSHRNKWNLLWLAVFLQYYHKNRIDHPRSSSGIKDFMNWTSGLTKWQLH